MQVSLFLTILLSGTELLAQVDTLVRKQSMDYTQYDKLVTGLAYAADKQKATDEFLAYSDKHFTIRDEEYFYTRNLVSYQYEALGNYLKATEVLQQAIDAYERHYPFYHRGYPLVSQVTIGLTYGSLARCYNAQHLYEKNIRFLEHNRALLENSQDVSTRKQFYSSLGESLYQSEQYDEAIKVLLKLKELSESGALSTKYQTAEELYKIDPTWPAETQTAMQKAREEYKATIKKTMEMEVIYNRFEYSRQLAGSYFKQYDFESCTPYAKQLVADNKVMMQYMNEAFKLSEQTMQNANVHDSLKE